MHMSDEFAFLKYILPVGRFAGQQIKFQNRYFSLHSILLLGVNYSFERHESDAHIRGMRCDAAIAGSQHSVATVHTANGVATGTRLSLIAMRVHVPEVWTTRFLQKIPCGACHVA